MQVLCLILQHSRRFFLVSNTKANAVLPSTMAVCTRGLQQGWEAGAQGPYLPVAGHQVRPCLRVGEAGQKIWMLGRGEGMLCRPAHRYVFWC